MQVYVDKISELLHNVDNFIWGPVLQILILGTGMFLLVKMKFLPIRNLGYALKCVVGRDKKHKDYKKFKDNIKYAENKGDKENKDYKKSLDKGEGDISPISALTTELAATIGTGNIVGVATALVLGGPGALIWMNISAIIGLSTKFTESMLAVKYRCKNASGSMTGGPMYTLKNGFKNKRVGALLGLMFAFFAVMASFGMGNMVQSNSISMAIKESFNISTANTGLIITIIVILVIVGGIKSISKFTLYAVPFMAIFYILGSLLVIFANIENVPRGIMEMFKMAFSPSSVACGVGGSIMVSMSQSMRWGISRGVFSNEAGLGAAGISAAAAKTNDYVRQGYISMTGVFFDTIVICTITGLVLSASGVIGMRDSSGELVTGCALTIAAFSTVLGKWGGIFVSIGIVFFALATIIGWEYQGEKAFEYIVKKEKYCIWYRFVYGLVTFVGAVCTLEVVWSFSDIMNGLMAIPNLICVLVLWKIAATDIINYKKI